jgi:aspartate ammonia-lyase
VSGVTLADMPEFLDAYVQVKIAATRANAELGVVPEVTADAILEACREILAGDFRDQFPVPLVQGGGGTAANMNVNEVLANRAEVLLGGTPGMYRRVHPNDHVNRSQSTNDTYPTALQVATIRVGREALRGLENVSDALRTKGDEYRNMSRLGRTCLRDAVPLSVGAGHDAQAHAVERTSRDLQVTLDRLHSVPLGATLIGTGAGAPPRYKELAVAYLTEETALPLEAVDDPFDTLAHLDPLLGVASALTRAMLVLGKIAADLRLLASGPIGGVNEVSLPAVQVGSSLVPGKVNPVIPELVLQVSYETRGATHTIEAAVADGELELNVMAPVVALHLLASLANAGRVAEIFATRCIAQLRWNQSTVAAHLAGSLAESI